MNRKPNINLYWHFVREHYPDGEAEANDAEVYTCVRADGEYLILDGAGRELYRRGRLA